ncbi:MAG: ribbon-helix-helix protein, CopG family [Nitrospira sp.]
MKDKRTMTLNLTDAEMAALQQLCKDKEMNKTAVIRQAIRLYQFIEIRRALGEKLYFEDDQTKEKKELVVL